MALPEILVTSAEFAATEGDNGVGAAYGPVHASPFEPGSDRHFTASLDDPGGSA